jgi:hypothetical protein
MEERRTMLTDEVVWVRNKQLGPTVFTDSATKVQIEWAGDGDPSGNDVQQVPIAVLGHVQFMRHLQKGIFTVEGGSDVATEFIARQSAAWQARRGAEDAAIRATIVEEAKNDIVVLACVGPSGRGGKGICGADVTVREIQRNDAPPLCSKHADLKAQYVPEHTEELIEGEAVVKWVRTTLAPRERASAAVVATP